MKPEHRNLLNKFGGRGEQPGDVKQHMNAYSSPPGNGTKRRMVSSMVCSLAISKTYEFRILQPGGVKVILINYDIYNKHLQKMLQAYVVDIYKDAQ